jgi:hypothetical protein
LQLPFSIITSTVDLRLFERVQNVVGKSLVVIAR